jgi:multiple antibiotic resistance protein
MPPFLADLLRATVALLVVVDPAGLLPIVLGLTRDMQQEARRRTLRLALLTSFVLLIIFAVAGQQLLLLFGITIYSFMIAGGILLLILAVRMLVVRGEFMESATSGDDIGVVPIAFPLLVGPGAITTTIVTLQTSGIVIALLSIAIVIALTWVMFRYIDRIDALLGRRGSAVLSKLMAIFIAAIAVQFIITGIQFYYPTR